MKRIFSNPVHIPARVLVEMASEIERLGETVQRLKMQMAALQDMQTEDDEQLGANPDAEPGPALALIPVAAATMMPAATGMLAVPEVAMPLEAPQVEVAAEEDAAEQGAELHEADAEHEVHELQDAELTEIATADAASEEEVEAIAETLVIEERDHRAAASPLDTEVVEESVIAAVSEDDKVETVAVSEEPIAVSNPVMDLKRADVADAIDESLPKEDVPAIADAIAAKANARRRFGLTRTLGLLLLLSALTAGAVVIGLPGIEQVLS